MKLVWPLALAAAGLATLNALGQSDKYVFDIVAEADPVGEKGFVSILSASMNADGAVAFAAMVAGETVPAVYFFADDENGDIESFGSVPNAVGPVLNNDGWIVFLSLDDKGQIVDISRYDPDSKGGPVLVHDAGDEVLAGLASTGGDPPADIAYWSACLDPDPDVCKTTQQCVVVLDHKELGECAEFPDVQLSSPAINDDLVLSYIRSQTDVEREHVLVLGDEEPLAVGPGGRLSSPTINAGGTVAVFCDDPDNPEHERAGIYTVTGQDVDLLEPLDGDRLPALNTRPFIYDNGAVAYTAIEDDEQAVFAQNDGESVAVIAEGDTLDEDPPGGEVVSLEVFARNSCQILFMAGLDDDGDDLVDRTMLVRAMYRFDLDGSGTVDFGDILAIFRAWDNTGGPEDLNDDGIVDLRDFLVLLQAWGPCL